MGCHQVLTCLLCVSCDDHERTNDLLCLRKVGARLAIEDPFEVLYFSQLSKGFLELISSEVDQGNVSFDLASSDVFQSVGPRVYLECFVEVGECFIDLASLLLPGAELSCDSS